MVTTQVYQKNNSTRRRFFLHSSIVTHWADYFCQYGKVKKEAKEGVRSAINFAHELERSNSGTACSQS